jgi:uncharacterized protein (TIGR03545 family)
MKRWIRWSYVVPRLGGVVLFLFLISLGASPAAKWILVRAGQAATGAAVDVGDLKLSLLRGQLRIDSTQFADPDNPLKNMAQFKRAELKIDTTALTHKRLVVDSGKVEGIQFGGDRTTSGELAKSDGKQDLINEENRERAKKWLAQFAGLLSDQVANNLESVQVARNLSETWPAEYQQWDTRADLFEKRIGKLRMLVKAIRNNPLQHVQELQQIAAETKSMAGEIASAKKAIAQIKPRIESDKDRMRYALLRDRGRVEETIRLTSLDGDAIAEYFMGEYYASYATEAVAWASWAKQYLDLAGEPPEVERLQGADVRFRGLQQQPAFLIKRVDISGFADMKGEPAMFQGVLSDLSSSPTLHKHPAMLQLSLQGKQPANVKMVWDYRTDDAFQELTIKSPMPAHTDKTLGDRDSLAIAYSADAGQAWLQARIADGELKGQLVIQQSGARFQPIVANKMGGEHLRRPLAAGIAGLDHIDVVIHLDGPLRKPRLTFDSNVGRQLADGLNKAVRDELIDQRERVLEKGQQLAAKELLQLDALVERKQAELLARYANQANLIRELTGINNLGTPLTSALPVSDAVRERLRNFKFPGMQR